MRSTKKIMLLAAVLSGAFAMSACGDANTGSPGEFKTAGGEPSQDPSGAAPGGTSTPGGGGPSTGTSPPAAGGGTFAVSMTSATLASELQMTSAIPITITPASGFTGTVTLSATGLPAGATGTFSPATVDITGTAPMTAMYTLDVPATATPSATAASVSITGTAGTATASAPLALTIKREITIVIPLNVEATANAFGTAPITVHTGVGAIGAGNPFVVNFKNLDTSKPTGHEVHSSNTNNNGGFFHGTANLLPNQLNGSDGARNVTVADTYPFYCHGETDSNGVQNKPDNSIIIMSP